MKIALVTAIAAFSLDEDLAPLHAALVRAGAQPEILAWDDPTVSWSRFDIALLRSPWDYTERLPEFLAWATRVSTQTRLLNPLAVIERNTDKHYLADLAKARIATVPSLFVEPGDNAGKALDAFLKKFKDTTEFVASGYNIFGSLVGQQLVMALVYFTAVSIAGYFFLKTREIAA